MIRLRHWPLFLGLCFAAASGASGVDYFTAGDRFALALKQPVDPVELTNLGRNAADVDPERVLRELAAYDEEAPEPSRKLALDVIKSGALLRARRLIDARAAIETLPEPQSLGDDPLAANVQLLKVSLAQFTGNLGEAQALVVDVLERLDRSPVPRLQLRFSALGNLTAVQARLRNWDGAAETSAQALALARELNDPMMIARALLNRGQVDGQRGDHEAVQEMLAEARALAATLPPGDLAINLDLAEASNASDRGRSAESRVALERALATARALGNRYYEAFALSTIAFLQAQGGESERAAQEYARSEAIFAEIAAPEEAARMARAASEEYKRLGQLDLALAARERYEIHNDKVVSAVRESASTALERTLLVQRKNSEIANAKLAAERDSANAAAHSLKAQFALSAALLTAAVALALGLWVMGLKRHNRVLKQLDRSRAELLARAAHEVRNPLAAIQGLLDMALAQLPKSSDLHRLLNPARAAAVALIDTTQDYLDHARLSLGRMDLRAVDFELHELVESVCMLYREQAAVKGVSLDLEFALDKARFVHGDAQKLRQILGNLIGNAVKFSDSGAIEVIVTAGAGERVRFVVADQGPGISSRDHAAVFQPFARPARSQNVPGIGLGLSIARQLTECLGGSLKLESASGVGAQFAFEIMLPSVARPAREAAPAAPCTSATFAALIVDDEPYVRALMRLQLESLGISVDEAHSVDTGLSRWRAGGPSLLLIDYHLDDRLGTDLISQILAEAGDHPPRMVIVSASMALGEKPAGVSDWYAKPLSLATLSLLAGQTAGALADAKN